MLKESGYDEFLAMKIAKAEADIAAGRFVTLEEAQQQWQNFIEKKALEMAILDEELENELYA